MSTSAPAPTTLQLSLTEASGAVASILALARQILPLIPKVPNGVGIVLAALESALPLLTDQIPILYQEVVTMIESFKTSGAASPDQIAAANDLLAKVKDHWAATKAAYLAAYPDPAPAPNPTN